jgi:hypothetical protein
MDALCVPPHDDGGIRPRMHPAARSVLAMIAPRTT